MVIQNFVKNTVQILAIITILAISPLLVKTSVKAQGIIQKSSIRTYTLKDDYVEVKESKTTSITQAGYQLSAGSKEAFTIFYPLKSDPDSEAKIKQTLDSLTVTDKNGNILTYTTKNTDTKNIVIEVPFPSLITVGNPETLTLSYKSFGLVVLTGAVRDVYVPGFPKDYKLSENQTDEQIETTLVIPGTYGDINFINPEIDYSADSNGNKAIKIPFEQLRGNTVWAQIGKNQYFEFEFKQKVPKSSDIPFMLNTLTLPIPNSVNPGPIKQDVFYTEISPKPYSIIEDADGNLIATFKVAANKENEIIIKGYATLSQNNDFDIKNAGSLASIDPVLVEANTIESEKFWQVNDPEIKSVANELKGDSTDVYEILNNTYSFVIDKIDYDFVKKYGINERQGALATLRGGGAVCMEYSDLFITLMRAQGVPARAAFGYAYSSLDFESQSENKINHQWAEVYLPNQKTWVNVDTTWGDFGNNLIGGDLNHFYSHVASVDPEIPSSTEISFFGNIKEIPERYMNIKVVGSIAKEDSDIGISVESLLEDHKKPSGVNAHLEYASIGLRNFDNDFTKIINNLGVKSELGINLIKVSLLVLPILAIILIYILKNVKLKKKVNGKKGQIIHNIREV